jgi:hypothetical protein
MKRLADIGNIKKTLTAALVLAQLAALVYPLQGNSPLQPA